MYSFVLMQSNSRLWKILMILKILKEINTNLQPLSPLTEDQKKFSSLPIARAFYLKSILHAATWKLRFPQIFPLLKFHELKLFLSLFFIPWLKRRALFIDLPFLNNSAKIKNSLVKTKTPLSGGNLSIMIRSFLFCNLNTLTTREAIKFRTSHS